MVRVHPATDSVFRLRFRRGESETLLLEASGKAAVVGNDLTLNFDGQRHVVGWRTESGFVIRTMCRNTVPLYVRNHLGEVWISNDVAELAIAGETLAIRAVEVVAAVKSPSAIKSVAAHLLEDISLLLPASFYAVNLDGAGGVRCVWHDVVFQETWNSRDDFLEFLIERYRAAFSGSDQVCLGLSGGYDSRLELAILTHLNKTVHCFHFERMGRERRLASRVASACGANFQAIPVADAVRMAWALLHDRGYTTRWDGYFSAGAIPAAGICTEMERVRPQLPKQLLITGTLRGRLYDKAERVFDYWRNTEHDAFVKLGKTFPDLQRSIDAERERRRETLNALEGKIRAKTDRADVITDKRRRETLNALEGKIRAKTDRADVITDIGYHFHYKSVGKVATRSTFLIENGMPILLADQAVRDRFAALPVAEKRNEAFLEWAIGRLEPRLAGLSFVSSSERTLGRQFGIAARWPIAQALLKQFRVPDIGDLADWMSEAETDSILRQLPELGPMVAQAGEGNANLYVSMILQFLPTLQGRKNVSYRISH